MRRMIMNGIDHGAIHFRTPDASAESREVFGNVQTLGGQGIGDLSGRAMSAFWPENASEIVGVRKWKLKPRHNKGFNPPP